MSLVIYLHLKAESNVNIRDQVEKEEKLSFSFRTQASVIQVDLLIFIMIGTLIPLYARYCARPHFLSASPESRLAGKRLLGYAQ